VVDGHPLPAVTAAVITGVPISLENVFLIEGEGVVQRPPNKPLEPDDRWDEYGDRGGSHEIGRILYPLCTAGEEQDDGPAHVTNPKGFKGSVENQNSMRLHRWPFGRMPFGWASGFHPG
jgi:hypothetical protein